MSTGWIPRLLYLQFSGFSALRGSSTRRKRGEWLEWAEMFGFRTPDVPVNAALAAGRDVSARALSLRAFAAGGV
jgi:hypothetical protein